MKKYVWCKKVCIRWVSPASSYPPPPFLWQKVCIFTCISVLLSPLEKFEENFEKISRYHWSDKPYVPFKVGSNLVPVFLSLFMQKKEKENLMTKLIRNKITWITFLYQKSSSGKNNPLNSWALACHENLQTCPP